MNGLYPWLYALVALNSLTTLATVCLLYELRQLRAGKAAMSYWDRIEAIRQNTRPAPQRQGFL